MGVEGNDPKVVHGSRFQVSDKKGRLGQLGDGLPDLRAKVLLLNLCWWRVIEAADTWH